MATNLMGDTDLFLSPNETAPKGNDPAPAQDGLVLECPECGAKKGAGPAALPFVTQAQLRKHIANKHGRSDGAKPKASVVKRERNRPGPKPAPRASRRSTSEFFSKMLTNAGKFLENVSPAGGKSLSFSAYAAGPAIDSLISGTRLDKPMQKIVTASDKWEKVADAIGLPIMVTMCDLDQTGRLFFLFEDQMREAIGSVMIQALPHLKAKKEKENQAAAALLELGALDPSLAGEDPVGDILRGFFSHRIAEQPDFVEQPA